MMLSVNAVTIFPNAAPNTTATARSITLPLTANSLNSLMKPMIEGFGYLKLPNSIQFSPILLKFNGLWPTGVKLNSKLYAVLKVGYFRSNFFNPSTTDLAITYSLYQF